MRLCWRDCYTNRASCRSRQLRVAQVVGAQHLPLAVCNRALDGVFELAHIPRPAIFPQLLEGVVQNSVDPGAVHPNEVPGQLGDILRPLAQGWRSDLDKVVEVFTERPIRDGGQEIPVRGADNPDIDAYENEIRNIPIPEPADPKPIETLVNKILAAKRRDAQEDTSVLEREIDAQVYALYG